jgi:hypothetical protein
VPYSTQRAYGVAVVIHPRGLATRGRRRGPWPRPRSSSAQVRVRNAARWLMGGRPGRGPHPPERVRNALMVRPVLTYRGVLIHPRGFATRNARMCLPSRPWSSSTREGSQLVVVAGDDLRPAMSSSPREGSQHALALVHAALVARPHHPWRVRNTSSGPAAASWCRSSSALEGSQRHPPRLAQPSFTGSHQPWRVRNVIHRASRSRVSPVLISPGGFATPTPPRGCRTGGTSSSALEGSQLVLARIENRHQAGRHPPARDRNPGTDRRRSTSPGRHPPKRVRN